MEEIGRYKTLLELPLFLGLNADDLQEIVAHTRLGFQKFHKDQTVIREGDACTGAYLLQAGRLGVTTVSHDHSYEIEELMTAPNILQPENLFGLNQRYTKTFKALEQCNFIMIDKGEILRLADSYNIFKINLLNILSAQIQKQQQRNYRQSPTELTERIVRFIADRCLRPAGRVGVKIKMSQLGKEINDSRLNVSKALNTLQDQGLVTLSRGHIEIPQLEKLF
ncbi:Crp/Fnr family transcriptional regulator [Prevotella sp. A2931]|uniref:Crp/Fnr family transcriptional regulator n=1 Tax=Prevotella illustrans TaxID=2800387 RepID=A0ABS3M5R2_9BACT|nr:MULTISPECIES: Crp/Fnr family transcriptional regulator [Prevotella]MBO1363519.1 Crp/Fnr family transcriptional regulator [Prevotella illustrans]PTL25988.1 Crp/Fnr family transcriptional regulator [Prevotella sp. oral taxon 820]